MKTFYFVTNRVIQDQRIIDKKKINHRKTYTNETKS